MTSAHQSPAEVAGDGRDTMRSMFRGGRPASRRPSAVFVVDQFGPGRAGVLARLRARFSGNATFIPAASLGPSRPKGGQGRVWSMEDARERRVDVIIEDGFQDRAAAFRAMQAYADAGYRTEVVAVSSAAYASQIAAQQQYRNAQRAQSATPPGHRRRHDGTAVIISAAMAVAACHVVSIVDPDDVELVRLARDAHGEWRPANSAETAGVDGEQESQPAQSEQAVGMVTARPLRDQARDQREAEADVVGDEPYVDQLERIIADVRSIEVYARDGDADVEEESQQIFEDHRHAEREQARGPRLR